MKEFDAAVGRIEDFFRKQNEEKNSQETDRGKFNRRHGQEATNYQTGGHHEKDVPGNVR